MAVALAVPVEADTNADDRQFLAELKAEGWTINSPRVAISQARMVCNEGLLHGVTWQEMRTTLIGYGFSKLDASTLISKAVKVYCPEYSEVVAEIKDDLGDPGTGNQEDLFINYLNQTWGISIDKDAAVDMARTACKAPRAGVGWYNALTAMKQRYPGYDVNTIGRVMAAANLAYCPDRLP